MRGHWPILLLLLCVVATTGGCRSVDYRNCTEDDIPKLIENLGAWNWRIRHNAAYALGRLGPKAAPAVDALIIALDDNHYQVRSSAAYALGRIGAPARKALPKLHKVAANDPIYNTRELADRAIRQLEAIPVPIPVGPENPWPFG